MREIPKKKRKKSLDKMTRKRYAALAVYLENLPDRKKGRSVRAFADRVTQDVLAMQRMQRDQRQAQRAEAASNGS